ncbi:uncharacterized protein PHACADRAFT_206043 [Phanerochaete carnosa HHB-10118-sp]|uniref:F-box domain-containing protein n=1 Tax=Phanerochaete carnosa (strain HHB-10118-sp) TaxID=650164 RepID=K5VAG2_PHACS|nr:uncharacterized protein PHACADRAFT_206043 [Phanerochaete carnosa HHB-10118-sp]EKM59831.1 hypothetical protein PHACADRAFT_206043 [Phanerochaete carnosa HHB-10118-sp]
MNNVPLDVIREFFYHLISADGPQGPWPDTLRTKQDLAACTLVSRTWRLLAQPYLFRDIHYSYMNPTDDSAYGQIVETRGRWIASASYSTRKWLPRKTFTMFCDFLKQSPNLAGHIRRLVLTPAYPSILPALAGANVAPVSIASFNALLQLLPQLRKLSLINFTLDAPAEFHFHPPSGVPSLVQLDMINDSPKLGIAILAGVLGCFSAIGKLRLMGMDMPMGYSPFRFDPPPESEPTGLVPAYPVRVQHFILGAAEPQVYMGVLTRFIHLEGVRSLRVMPCPNPWLYESLIGACGPSLEELTLFFAGDDLLFKATPKPLPVPSIAPCRNLRRLTLITSVGPAEALSASPDNPRDERSPKELLQEQLAPVTTLLAKADGLRRASFPHFSALAFRIDVGLHGFAGGTRQVVLGDVPCEGAADRLDAILYELARELPEGKIPFVFMDMTMPGQRPGEHSDGSGPEGERVVGGEMFLGRLFPRLKAHGMIEVGGVSSEFPDYQ